MPSPCAKAPPGAILPGLTERKPSGIPAATVLRPWGFGQFQLSFPVKPRRIPRPSGKVRAGRWHPLAGKGAMSMFGEKTSGLVVLLLAEQRGDGGW
jgi:hypothetical protein